MCVVEFFLISLLLQPSSPSAEGDVRLVNTDSAQCYGRVELFHAGEWGTVCDDGWSMSDATVVCRQLDCGTAVDFIYGARFGQGTGQIWLKEVKCSGEESALAHCPKVRYSVPDCKHYEDAGVVCMKPPTISTGVTWGQEVSVTCSVTSAFTGGHMVLKDFNKTLQTSNSNPATFTFPQSKYKDVPVFHCLYQKLVLEQMYSSPQSASVTAESPVPRIQMVAFSTAGGVLLALLSLLSVLIGVVYQRRRSTTQASAPPQVCVGAASAEHHDEVYYATADLPSDDDSYENVGQEQVDEEVCVRGRSAEEVCCATAEDQDEVCHAEAEDQDEVCYAEAEDQDEVCYATAEDQDEGDYENVCEEEDYENVGPAEVDTE